MMNVYARAAVMLRARLAGRRPDFVERCVQLGLWLLRQHAPYGGRVFAVPRGPGGRGSPLEGRAGLENLTYSHIRSASDTLQAVGLLVRISEPRAERRRKDPPTQFVIGADFAFLFPAAQSAAARAAAHVNAARSAPNPLATSRARIQIQAPLFVATRDNLMPRPMRWVPPRPKTERDLAEARLAVLAERVRAEPLPLLSPLVLRGFGLTPPRTGPAARSGQGAPGR